MKDEELKEDLIDKLGIALRMVRRAVAGNMFTQWAFNKKNGLFSLSFFNKEVLPEEIFLSWHSCPVWDWKNTVVSDSFIKIDSEPPW